jgi:hypothetical protein
MKTYILRKKSGRETCQGIVNIANDPEFKVAREKDIPKLQNVNTLIRWGSTENCPAKFTINTVEAIQLVNNKVNCRKKMIEKEISCPKTFFSKEDAKKGKFPQIGRATHHSQGKDIFIANNAEELNKDLSSTYWSEFIDKQQEFRVFCFMGKVLGVCEKIPKNKELIPWNASLGNGVFETVGWKHFPKKAVLLALKAMKEVGADFGGVDIIVKDNIPYLLEINSSCEMSNYRQELFAKAFKWLVSEIEKNNEKPKHFDYPAEYKKYAHVLHPCLFNGEEAAEENNDFEEEGIIAAAKPKQEVIHIELPKKETKLFVPPVVNKNDLPDETHKLLNITDVELRSVGQSLMIYGKIAGGNNKHVKIMEISNPEVKYFWED